MPEVFKCPVTIYPVRDIISEGMPEHPFAVVFLDSILLAQAAESMAAVMGRMPLDAEGVQLVIHVLTEPFGGTGQQFPIFADAAAYQWEYVGVDRHDPVFAGCRFYAAFKVFLI